MPQPRPTLLLTRPEAESQRFALRFQDRFGADWPTIVSPLTVLRDLDADLDLAGMDGVIFTSQAAVAAFARRGDPRGLRAWCVGARTAAAAAAVGFDVVTGPGDATGLAAMIRAQAPGARLVHLCGRHVAHDMGSLLKSAGIETVSTAIYDQIAVVPTAEALSAAQGRAGLLLPLFSRRAAGLAQSLQATAPLFVAAISAAVASEASALAPVRLETAQHPDAEGMLVALAALIAAATSG